MRIERKEKNKEHFSLLPSHDPRGVFFQTPSTVLYFAVRQMGTGQSCHSWRQYCRDPGREVDRLVFHHLCIERTSRTILEIETKKRVSMEEVGGGVPLTVDG